MPNTKIDLPLQIDLEQFISQQAHDLRTPFNHTTGFSKILLNTVGMAPLTDLQKEDLGTVYQSGMRALTLMNGLIDIARINRHEKISSSKVTDVEQLVIQSVVLWKKFNPSADVQLDYQILTGTKTILTDEQLNRQIISGFIALVALYCEAQTKISISVVEQPGWLLFTLTSTGTKARLPSDLDREMLGYVNRTLIEMQGGEIRLAEETDNGAILKFALPKK